MRRTLPRASQNSLSPYHWTANRLITLGQCQNSLQHITGLGSREYLRVHDDDNSNDGTDGDSITPVLDNDIASHNLERHQRSFENEEVITSSDTKSFIDVTTSKTNEWRRNW